MPFGYWMEKAAPGYTGPRVIHIDPTAARAIRMLLQLREEKRSYPVTAKALNEAGHLAPRGGLWTAGQVYAVERRAELYRTGRRRWDGIDAAQAWPVILEVSA